MNCDTCKFADWKRTSNGRLHPNKSGKCTFVWTPPPLPKAFYFYGSSHARPNGGSIERGSSLTDGCPCYSPATLSQGLTPDAGAK